MIKNRIPYKILYQLCWIFTCLFSGYMFLTNSESGIYERFFLLFIIWFCGFFSLNSISKPTKNPKYFFIIINFLLLTFAYLLQIALYEYYNTNSNDILILGSLFSDYSNLATGETIDKALLVITAAYVGFLLFVLSSKVHPLSYLFRDGYNNLGSKSNYSANIVFFSGVILFVFSSIPRYVYSLHNPEKSISLAYNLAGIVNITNTQISISVISAGIYLAFRSNNSKLARRYSYFFLIIGFVQYLLFLSKQSIFIPLAIVIAMSLFFNFKLIKNKHLLIIVICIFIIYPFLNTYRSLSNNSEIGFFDFNQVVEHKSEYANNIKIDNLIDVLSIGVSGFWARLTGLDPLLVVILSQENWSPNFWDFILSDTHLDRYITYEVLEFETPMGYSPGFLGRLIFMGNNLLVVLFGYVIWLLFGTFLIKYFSNSGVIGQSLLPSLFVQLILISTSGPSLSILSIYLFSFLSSWLFIFFFVNIKK